MKRLFQAIMVCMIVLSLLACTAPVEDYDAVFEEAMESILFEGDRLDAVIHDLNREIESLIIEEARITWKSSRKDVITDTGRVLRPEDEAVDVEITVYVTIGFTTRERTYVLTVLPLGRYTITLQTDHEETTYEVIENRKIEPPPHEEKLAFEFIGWKDQATNDFFDFDQPITKDLVLIAVYRDRTYDVTFDSRGGTEVDDLFGVIHSMTIDSIEEPTREGYTFIGWIFIDSFGNEQLLVEGRTLINNDIHAFARWLKHT